MHSHTYFNVLLGKYLKERRKELGMTQQQVCDHFGFTCQFYGKIEMGAAPCPAYILKELVVILRLKHSKMKKIFIKSAEMEVNHLFDRAL
jgi:transcriptional regulator with XRE-family HTH domain